MKSTRAAGQGFNPFVRAGVRALRRRAKLAVWWWRYQIQPLRTDPGLTMESLVRRLVEPGETYPYEELERIQTTCRSRDRRLPEERTSGSTRVQDTLFLYLLVRRLRPGTIFEVGTLIGTSASTMAYAQAEYGNGGMLHTVDGSYGGFEPSPEQAIRCFRGQRSHDALETMRTENRRIDLVFIDGTIGRRDVEALNQVRSPDLVIALHDYKPPIDKGIRNAWMIDRYFDGADQYAWILPERQGVGYPLGDGRFVNSSVAVSLPESVRRKLR